MHAFLVALNSFLEDSSVLVAVAYLLTRGHLLSLLFPLPTESRSLRSRANILVSGLIFGAIGATEYLFPNLRYPYSTPTLFVTFAAFSRGLRVGVIAEIIVLLGAMAGGDHRAIVTIAVAITASLFVGDLMRRLRERLSASSAFQARGYLKSPETFLLVSALICGVVSQAVVIGLRTLLAGVAMLPLPHDARPAYALASIPANGIGMALLQLIVREARQRTEAARLRREAEAARAFAAQQQLVALRARVHPHFLFNTLNSIAALCALAPDRAETATVQLADVMRRVLEAAPDAVTAVENEVADARAYVEIESHRYGDRLVVEWNIAPETRTAQIPPFALTTLVDNAVNHGIAARGRGGRVVITVRLMRGNHAKSHVLISVADNGVGMPPAARAAAVTASARPHGLLLLNDQLRLIYGPRARLRIFSRIGAGTLIVFAVPASVMLTPPSRAASRPVAD